MGKAKVELFLKYHLVLTYFLPWNKLFLYEICVWGRMPNSPIYCLLLCHENSPKTVWSAEKVELSQPPLLLLQSRQTGIWEMVSGYHFRHTMQGLQEYHPRDSLPWPIPNTMSTPLGPWQKLLLKSWRQERSGVVVGHREGMEAEHAAKSWHSYEGKNEGIQG